MVKDESSVPSTNVTFPEDYLPVDRLSLGFPVYAVEFSPKGSVLLVAGGGGPGKTGIRNSIMSFRYNARTRQVKMLSELSCGEEAPMCMALHPTQTEYLAVGVNDRCWIVERDNYDRLLLMKSIRTDFAASDSYQKIVFFSPDGHRIITSGNEDHVRMWHFPWMNATGEFVAPPNAAVVNPKDSKIEDADYGRDGVSLAILTSGAINIRNCKENKFVATLLPLPEYTFRCVRFIQTPGRNPKNLLVTVENSKGKGKPMLSLWSTDSWTRRRMIYLKTRLRVTTMSVSSNGRFIAIGAADGTVAVYDYRLYRFFFQKELHKFIVTSVAVVEEGNARFLITGSGDGGVRIIHLRKTRPWTWIGILSLLIFLSILTLFILFVAGIIGDPERL